MASSEESTLLPHRTLDPSEASQIPSKIILDTISVHEKSVPWWAYILLVASVLSVSSAGVVFALMKDVHPLRLAGWRLQSTSILLVVGAAVQWRSMPQDQRRDTLASTRLLALAGTSLAVHFGTWVASVEWTSLAHSLLFVTATPLLLALVSWVRRLPISRGEVVGIGIGICGNFSLAASATSEKDVSLIGDAAAFTASIAFVPYLLVGRLLRAWMPLFVYTAPVTSLAATLLTCAGTLENERQQGMFGWLSSLEYFPKILYLGIVPGLIGHTGINILLKHIDPLVITLALNMEPLLGSLLGWMVGVAAPPGKLTVAGGILIMVSTALVSLASAQRERQERERQRAADEVKNIMMSSLDEL